MRAFVRFTTPGGTCQLGHGDLIGRLASAALVLNDPRISEAHAMVSLRRGALYLLALRRRIAIDGHAVREARLQPGMVITLADRVDLRVDDVVAQLDGLGLSGPGLGQRLLAHVTSVRAGPPLTVIARFVPDAAAVLWSVGDEWRLRLGDAPPRTVGPGDRFRVGHVELTLATVVLDHGGPASTEAGGPAEPLRLVIDGDEVLIHRGRSTLALTGLGARLISELAAIGGPLAWEPLARELWGADVTAIDLRRRLDAVLKRLRATLRQAGVRADLVASDGTGQVQLILYGHDIVEGDDAHALR